MSALAITCRARRELEPTRQAQFLNTANFIRGVPRFELVAIVCTNYGGTATLQSVSCDLTAFPENGKLQLDLSRRASSETVEF